MTNNEKLFRLLGWTLTDWRDYSISGGVDGPDVNGWVHWEDSQGKWQTGNIHPKGCSEIDHSEGCLNCYLPDVSNSYELCRRWIIPEMRERGWVYWIEHYYNITISFVWGSIEKNTSIRAELKDDNIAAALVESAIEVLEGEK